jgi:hypothetical protein
MGGKALREDYTVTQKKVKASILLILILIGSVLSCCLFSGLFKTVQAYPGPDPEWKQNYGGYLYDEKSYSVVQTSDGGYMLAGTIYSYPYPPTGTRSLLVKTDSAGNMQWNGTYPGYGNNIDTVRSVVQTSDGGYVFAGYTSISISTANIGAWLVKVDSTGNQIWNQIYAAWYSSYVFSMVKTSDGGFALAGQRMASSSSTYYETMLLKTDSSGNIMWSNTYGAGVANSVVQTSDGGYILAGSALYKTDSTGNLQWTKPLGDSEAKDAYSIVQTSDGGFAYAGDKGSLQVGNDIFMVKTDSNGNFQWANTYGGSKDDACYSLVQISDGGYMLAGRTKSYGAGNWDGYLIKTDSNGVQDWWNYYGGAYDDGLYCVIKTSDGGSALSGYSKSYTNGGYDMWLIKMGALPSTYSATIWAWDALDSNGWIAEPITMDGTPTGFSTPHTFAGLTGSHTFTVPDTDINGRAFGSWDTGETSTSITVGSEGIHTAQYASYVATIWAWDVEGWISEPITMDGVSTGFNTPHTFTGLTGTHTFTVPSTDVLGYPFSSWNTGEISTTLTVTSGGIHTAQYRFPAYLVVRGQDNLIYYRTYNPASGVWGGWSSLPGATPDSPAAVLCGNELHVVVRGMDGVSLYHGYVNLNANNSFSGWSWISGTTPSPPTLVSNGDALTLVVRGADNCVYYRVYTVSSRSWSSWHLMGSGSTCDKVSAVMSGNQVFLVIRGFSTSDVNMNNTLWQTTVDVDSGNYPGWTWIPGSVTSSPTLTEWQNGNGYCLVVRGTDNSIYINKYVGSVWLGWGALSSGSTTESPAATAMGDKLYIVVVGMDHITLWTSNKDLNTNAFGGWSWISGTTPSKPTLTS